MSCADACAFPRPLERTSPDDTIHEWGESGMTLREWYIGQALAGSAQIVGMSPDTIAERAAKIADAAALRLP